jgi:hypothetical protein
LVCFGFSGSVAQLARDQAEVTAFVEVFTALRRTKGRVGEHFKIRFADLWGRIDDPDFTDV